MIIDNKGRLFGKINIIDICVILVVVMAIAVTYFKFNFSAHSDVVTSNATATYTIRAYKVRSFTADAIAVGDKVFDKETDKFVGTVTAVSSAQAKDFVTLSDGVVKSAPMPDRYDVEVSIECPVVVKNGATITESGKQLYLNQRGAYYTQTVESEFEMIKIDVK